MDTTNGLQMNIKNGSFSINDSITIVFAEASLTFPIKGKPWKLPEGTKIAYMSSTNVPVNKSVKKASVQKQPVIKLTQQKGGKQPNPERVAVEKAILDLLQKNNSVKCKEVLPLIMKEHETASQKMVENIFTKLKEKKIIRVIDRGEYSLSTTKEKVLPVVKKVPAPSKKHTVNTPSSQESEQLESYHFYTNSEPIQLGDTVKILNAEDAVHEDDILMFEPVEEHSGKSATIVNCDEGSNMVKIKIDNANVILVYPHWIKLTGRSAK